MIAYFVDLKERNNFYFKLFSLKLIFNPMLARIQNLLKNVTIEKMTKSKKIKTFLLVD